MEDVPFCCCFEAVGEGLDGGFFGAAVGLDEVDEVGDGIWATTRVARTGAADELGVLIVREIDRLSRNLAKQLIVEQELQQDGVQIEYVIGEYPDTPKGRLNKHIKATIAEYEREKIAERTTRARRRKVADGHVLTSTVPTLPSNNSHTHSVLVEVTRT